MAIVRFDGQRVAAIPVRQHGNGWIMKSEQHTTRLIPGTAFHVSDEDVISMGPVEKPGTTVTVSDGEFDAYNSQQSLDAAMAKERETLPSVQQVIRDNPPIAHDAPGKVNVQS